MIARLFRARGGFGAAPAGAVPPGERVYAIGDVHGRLDLLNELLALIDADDAGRGDAAVTLILLGDLIDRGPRSAEVVNQLWGLRRCSPAIRFLMGNHEEVFLRAMQGDMQALRFFLQIGGRETMLSYGVPPRACDTADHAALLAMLAPLVPAYHLDFLRGFEDLIVIGDYAFVHAGVRPDVPLARQRPGDLRWIRDGFLDHGRRLDKIVVHGHSIVADVEVRGHRIALDTGAYASGRLSAMGFEGDRRWVVQTRAAAAVKAA